MAHFNARSSSVKKEGVWPKLATHSIHSAGQPPLVKMGSLQKTPPAKAMIACKTPASKPDFQRTFDTPVKDSEATVLTPPPKPKFTETNQGSKSPTGSSPQPRPPLSAHKPFLKPSFAPLRSGGREGLPHQQESDLVPAPKKKKVPNAFTQGKPPVKPNRPPHVHLQRFQHGGTVRDGGCLKTSRSPVTRLGSASPASSASNTGPSSAEYSLPEHKKHDDGGILNNFTHLLRLALFNKKESSDKSRVYDDVGVCSGLEDQIAPGDDVYAEVGPAEEAVQCHPPPPIAEIYDDIESPSLTLKGKVDPVVPKMKNTFEKEEKEFRKKFHFKGDIQVLYNVTVVTHSGAKKWGNMDLHLTSGEAIDVIVRPDKGVLIGRNKKGKFGYVSTTHVVQDAGDVYDDIGEDCIYDNDKV